MPIEKKALMAAFQKDPKKHWEVEIFKEKGFMRRQCRKCGKFFWTLDANRNQCADSGCQQYEFIGNPVTRQKWDYIEMWKKFEKFFVENGHASIPRYPVVCRWRDDLYFVIASIVDFQRIEGGKMVFDYPANPLVVPQPCMRFNDIPNIGITGRHHSLFVMSEQAAFYNGKDGYWKDRCIELNFNFLTKVMGIPPEELVYIEDLWAGAGAFGPSLETTCRGLELVNSVFMQFEELEKGYRELPLKVIDVGWGHERLVWFSNGTPTGYEAVFGPVVEKIRKESNLAYDRELFLKYAKMSGVLDMDAGGDIRKIKNTIAASLGISFEELNSKIAPFEALYGIADHTRALAFAIADGGLPSNVGGGYNLRVILRRALGFIDEFDFPFHLSDIIHMHAAYLKPMFPELLESIPEITSVVESEEKKYRLTLEKSRRVVTDLVRKEKTISSEKLAQLYESQGITPELVEKVAHEENVSVSIPVDFYAFLTKGHMTPKKEEKATVDLAGLQETKQVYYKDPRLYETDATIKSVQKNAVVLDRTILYPEGGGQAADRGTINGIQVKDVQSIGGVIFHTLASVEGLRPGQKVALKIDPERRRALMRHHSATHIINYAARKVLGNHVWQAGARKEQDKAHLDITHFDKISKDELSRIEALANKVVFENRPIRIQTLERGEAEKKYGFSIYQGGGSPGKEVRIVEISGDDGALDVEACGGLHLQNTGEVGMIKIIKEERIQDGVSRIEFVAGEEVLRFINRREELLEEAVRKLNVPAEQLPATVERFFREWKERGKKNEELGHVIASLQAEKLLNESKDKAVRRIIDTDVALLTKIALKIAEDKDATAILANSNNDVVAAVGSSAKAKANELLKGIYSKFGGAGGGDERFARGKTKKKIEF